MYEHKSIRIFVWLLEEEFGDHQYWFWNGFMIDMQDMR